MTKPRPEADLAERLAGEPGRIAEHLRWWFSERDAFRRFAEDYADTIRKKLTSQPDDEDRRDVLAELEFAYRGLADPRFTFRYEHGMRRGRRSPDYLASVAGAGSFNLEVKRIREASATRKLHAFLKAILDSLAAVSSGAGVWIEINADDSPVGLVDRLEKATGTVVARCVDFVRTRASSLTDDEQLVIPIDGFEEDQLRITLDRLPNKSADAPTVYLGGGLSVPYTQKESLKFSDLLCGCLGQLRDGMANVLGVRVQSCTHDTWDFRHAIPALRERAAGGDDAFFRKREVADAAAFREQVRALSAVVIVHDWSPNSWTQPRNLVWLNPDASVPLPPAANEHFATM